MQQVKFNTWYLMKDQWFSGIYHYDIKQKKCYARLTDKQIPPIKNHQFTNILYYFEVANFNPTLPICVSEKQFQQGIIRTARSGEISE